MSDQPFAVVERNDLMPMCPHCHQELPEIYLRKRGTAFVAGKVSVFFCPSCRAVLGFGQERMI